MRRTYLPCGEKTYLEFGQQHFCRHYFLGTTEQNEIFIRIWNGEQTRMNVNKGNELSTEVVVAVSWQASSVIQR